MYISRLSLVNFRSYENLSLEFPEGLILLEGANGQGKSNLLEAAYLLAIAKSNRASMDREMVRSEARIGPQPHAQILAHLTLADGDVRLQVDFSPSGNSGNPHSEAETATSEAAVFHKSFRVNGVGRRASSVVGVLNAVMFGAEDLELVYGTPSIRRRYLDILISQLDDRYLRSLQRYHKILAQRNHLLKRIRHRSASPDELQFWDVELIAEASFIIEQRANTLASLNDIVAPLHSELAGADDMLELVYRPSIDIPQEVTVDVAAEILTEGLADERSREIAQGFTILGPHRDDVEPQIAGMQASAYASRGQVRTVVLAMKLAEAEHLKRRRGQEPVLLLDDVLSELDSGRRNLVLDKAATYQQCFITTAEPDIIRPERLSQMHRFDVKLGSVKAISITD
ncbi:MAG TPA: DNA replication/repair protein RecF [Dehalococcoidia bacterium]|nr:DNA replication/repair protein RecF [SAR202 cluster bacterium]HAC19953.1 DNA replication/repair protein RecF [Dehalococcoidia bacterium]HHZ63365.1 DNA replication/repair protein RecF [Dehalococcoidia bacterium]HIN72164.1 DNA replication/repair protein RecF [Dehalococcoidia bacterium]HIO62624.1 DNA replication/repair protein RecF [Dehalococcoidia bacterium]